MIILVRRRTKAISFAFSFSFRQCRYFINLKIFWNNQKLISVKRIYTKSRPRGQEWKGYGFLNPHPGHVVATLDRTFYDDYLWFRTISKFSGQDIEEIHRSIGPSKIPYASADFSEHLNYCLSQRTMCGLCRTINMQQLQISPKRSKIYLFAHYWW